MEIQLFRKEDLKVNGWSGGTTTELAIYPSDAVYSERNFMWRLSSATVDVETSTFTSLAGYNRILMILNGSLNLHHEGHYSVALSAFDQDRFNGGWQTKSEGKVVDFNLMMNEACDGSMESIRLENGDMAEFLFGHSEKCTKFDNVTEAFYCNEGSMKVAIENEAEVTLNQGDFLLASKIKCQREIHIALESCQDGTCLIRSTVFYD